MKKEKIVLLDLNSTLAIKTGLNIKTWVYDVSKDEYSKELVEALNNLGEDVSIRIVTARPKKYEEETLIKISSETDLRLDKHIFKPDNLKYKPVHEFKKDYLKSLLDDGYDLDYIIAVESNANTHRSYKELGLVNVWTRDNFLKECKRGRVFFPNSK
jgi:hypothetical protein